MGRKEREGGESEGGREGEGEKTVGTFTFDHTEGKLSAVNASIQIC